MTGKVKELQKSEGTAISSPTDLGIETVRYKQYSSDSAYETVWGSGTDGDTYYNTTTDKVRYYDGLSASWQDFGSGGGAGGVNFLQDEANAASGVSNWVYWDDNAGTATKGTMDVSQETSNIPLVGIRDTAIKLTVDGTPNAGDYAAIRTTLGLLNRKMGLNWYQDVSSYTASGIQVEVYSYSDSGYTTDETELTLEHDDTSGDFYIGDFSNGAQQNSFDIASDPYIEIRFIVGSAATGGEIAYLNDLKVGPGELTAGFAGWKQYTESDVTFSSTPTGWSLNSAFFVPYKSNNGEWRLQFNIDADITASAGYTFVIDGVTFAGASTSDRQSVTSAATSAGSIAQVQGNSGTVQVNSASTSAETLISGDVALASIPTWAEDPGTVYTSNTNPTTIAARYTTDTAQTIDTSTTTYLDFENKDFDETPSNSDAATTPGTGTESTSSQGAWYWTAPRAGIYNVYSSCLFQLSTDWGEADYAMLGIYVNGVLETYGPRTTGVSGNTRVPASVADNIKLNAGDYVEIAMLQTSGGTRDLSTSNAYNHVSITEQTAGPHAAHFANATEDRAGLVTREKFLEQTGLSGSATGGTGNTVDLTLARVGNVVTGSFVFTVGTSPSTGALTVTGALPSWAQPTNSQYLAITPINYATNVWASPQVGSSGNFVIRFMDLDTGSEVTCQTIPRGSFSYVVD